MKTAQELMKMLKIREEKFQDRGNYFFHSEWDQDMKVNRDIYLYKEPQKIIEKDGPIYFNRLEIENDPYGFDGESYTFAFYYQDDQIVKTN